MRGEERWWMAEPRTPVHQEISDILDPSKSQYAGIAPETPIHQEAPFIFEAQIHQEAPSILETPPDSDAPGEQNSVVEETEEEVSKLTQVYNMADRLVGGECSAHISAKSKRNSDVIVCKRCSEWEAQLEEALDELASMRIIIELLQKELLTLTNVETKKPSTSLKNSSRVPSNKNHKYDHKVKIIGDSHLKGSAARITQYLNTKFEVSSFIKPGARANQIVHSQEIEFRSLGRKDTIVINGGVNDIGNNITSRNKTLAVMTQFIQKYNNTNIIMLNIPHRHDLAKDSKTNFEIQAFNTKLNKTASLFSHVTLCEINFTREYFTKHGLHLNNAGKERLAKLIASQANKLVSDFNKTEPIIALNWKEETTNMSINVTNNHQPNLILAEEGFSNVLVPPSQIHNNQDNKADSELLRKTSNRQKKAPITRSKDFLWQL